MDGPPLGGRLTQQKEQFHFFLLFKSCSSAFSPFIHRYFTPKQHSTVIFVSILFTSFQLGIKTEEEIDLSWLLCFLWGVSSRLHKQHLSWPATFSPLDSIKSAHNGCGAAVLLRGGGPAPFLSCCLSFLWTGEAGLKGLLTGSPSSGCRGMRVATAAEGPAEIS